MQHESTIVAPIPGLYDIGTVAETFTTFGWMSWVVPLLLHELFVAAKRLYAGNPVVR